MNSKKGNWLFLAITLIHIAAALILSVYDYMYSLDITANLIISELILIAPALLFLVFTKGSLKEKLGLRRIKISSVLMVVLFTFLTMPLTTVINAISMLFVDNAVLGISGDVLSMPFFLMFLLMAVYGPVCEEVVFRGLLYQGYKNSGSIFQAMAVSAVLFGLMHMNFNQAAYAMVIGILLVMLVEASGSIYSSILYHIIFNGQSVCLLFLSNLIQPGMIEEQADVLADRDAMLYAIGFYMIIAAVTTVLAVCVLAWIARNENREGILQGIWKNRKQNRGKIWSVPLLAAVILCLGIMIWDVM